MPGKNADSTTNSLAKRQARTPAATTIEALAAVPEEAVWLAKQKSPRTRRAYKADVQHFMRFCGVSAAGELRRVDHRAVIAWERCMRETEGAEASTVRRRLAALSSLFKHLVEHGLADRNPVSAVRRPPINRDEGFTLAFSKAQARKLLDSPPYHTVAGLRDRAILSVVLQAGLRRAEIARLRVGDLHQNRGFDALRVVRKGARKDALAIHPQTAQRIRDYLVSAGQAADFDGPLFRPLTGSREAAARAAIRRLIASGILADAESGFEIPDKPGVHSFAGDERFHHVCGQVSHYARRVPVPRRMLRVLARSARPVFIATVIGHVVRCLFLRAGRVAPTGLCKARWIADVFGVDERNVKSARRELVTCGWLIVDPASQRFLNRWGLPVQVNLDWHGVAFEAPLSNRPPIGEPQSPPPEVPRVLQSPPPLKNTHRFQRSRNHVPEPARGVRGRQKHDRLAPLRNLSVGDLRSRSRLQTLFDEAVQAGLLRPCAADRLRFAAAAERAIALGTSNPPAFFATVVRRGLWHVISQRDEDAARRRRLEANSHSLGSGATEAGQNGCKSRSPSRLVKAGMIAAMLIAPLAPAATGGRSRNEESGG